MILASRQTTKKHRRGKQERKQERKQNRHTKKTDNREKQTSGLQKAPNFTRLYTKSFRRLQTLKFQKEISLY
jgi:hypothetical protein